MRTAPGAQTISRHALSALLLVCSALSCGSADFSFAQTVAPITSSGLNTSVTKSGPSFDITGGTRPGNGGNLFHSFGRFDVPEQTIANFVNDSGLPTANILSRITEGAPSNIFGAVQTTGFSSANLFLMNPAGIVFGPTASLNVGGSVHITSADYLRLADGGRFTALPGPSDAAISSAPVAAFGFLGSNPGALTVQGGQLTVPDGAGLSFVGGNISIQAGALGSGTSQPASLTAPGGRINLVAVASPGEVRAADTAAALSDQTMSAFTTRGAIAITEGAGLSTSAGQAGRIIIRGGQFTMQNSLLEAHSTSGTASSADSTSPTGDIVIQARQALLSDGAQIRTSAAEGQAGAIILKTDTLHSNLSTDGTPLVGAAPVVIASSGVNHGGPGLVALGGDQAGAAETMLLSRTEVAVEAGRSTTPTLPPGDLWVAARRLELMNGTVVRNETTGGADAGTLTMNVGTLKTQAGPDGRVVISGDSRCGGDCVGGQASYITLQGIPGPETTQTRLYRHVTSPDSAPDRPITYHFADSMAFNGTDVHSDAIGHAPGGIVMMRARGPLSLTDSTISVVTQDFEINGVKPNGQPATNQGFSRIDLMAKDMVMQDSTIKAGADVSDIGSCPLCQGGPSAGEIWLRVDRSFTADNSLIANTGTGRAQAGITKIIKDNYFSYGAIQDKPGPDLPAESIRLTNSEVTVEAKHSGLPGYLRLRADTIALDHSIVNSRVNNVTNAVDGEGRLIDVAGAGEAGIVKTDGRSVQGTLLMSAKQLDITGGGIIAPTTGDRIANRINLYTDVLTTHPGTRPGGTLAAPMVLNAEDPTRVVIATGSTGSGGAGLISIAGISGPIPWGATPPPATAIHLHGTDILTNTTGIGIGGKIELRATGPITLQGSTLSANVTNTRPPESPGQEHSGNISISAGSLSLHQSEISALSRGTQQGGNIVITTQDFVALNAGSAMSATNSGSANAGDIAIQAGSQFLSHDSAITTQASRASGGNITIQAVDAIRLANSRLNTSVQGGPTSNGGNILLDPAVVTIQNSHILAQATQGAGGNITIIAGAFLTDASSVLSASSDLGVSGSVTVQSPISNVSGRLATLPQQPLQVSALLRQRCAAQSNGQLSSFVTAGRDAVPSEPGGWAMSSLATLAELPTDLQHASSSSMAMDSARASLEEEPPQPFRDGDRQTWARGCRS